MTADQDLITAQALADVLHLSVETIWRYTREKKIPFIELGNRQYRYNAGDVIRSLSNTTISENPAPYQTEPARKLTYQDYLDLPEEPGCRFEILDGMLIKEPSPNVIHQRASRNLLRILEEYFWKLDPGGEIFNAPLDVTLNNINVVQPDVFYVSAKQSPIVKDTRVDGSPALVVEVISPSSTRKDRLQKMRVYQALKVWHFWLVDPQERTLECFALQDEVYALVASGMDEEIVEHPDFIGLIIPLGALWRKGNPVPIYDNNSLRG